MSTSTSINNDIVFTNTLSRLSTLKGTLLVNNGSIFELESVGTDNQVLTADSTTSTGVKWGSGVSGGNAITLNGNNFLSGGALDDAPGTTLYGGMPFGWLNSDSSVGQNGTLITSDTNFQNYSLRGASTNTDWVVDFSEVTGGTLDFTLGRISPSDIPNIANWTPYNLTPDFQIDDTFWDTDPNKPIVVSNLNIPISAGDLVSWRYENNYTTTGSGFSFVGDVLMSAVFF